MKQSVDVLPRLNKREALVGRHHLADILDEAEAELANDWIERFSHLFDHTFVVDVQEQWKERGHYPSLTEVQYKFISDNVQRMGGNDHGLDMSSQCMPIIEASVKVTYVIMENGHENGIVPAGTLLTREKICQILNSVVKDCIANPEGGIPVFDIIMQKALEEDDVMV